MTRRLPSKSSAARRTWSREPPQERAKLAPGTGRALEEYWLFLRELARSPWRTAAIVPSSEALGALMVSEIDPRDGYVVELGPGTGRFTEALLERGVPESHLIVVEANPRFAHRLKKRFPRASMRTGRAEELWREPLPHADEIAAVISGLPLQALRPQGQAAVLRDWYARLPNAQGFYQFTYAPFSPVMPARLREWGLESQRLGSVVLNVPPASVYRFRRLARQEPRLNSSASGRR